MKIKQTNSEMVFDICNVVFMFGLMCVTLYPMLYILFAAISNPASFMAHEGALFGPLGFSLTSFQAVFKNPNMGYPIHPWLVQNF